MVYLAVCIPHGKSCMFAVPLQVLYITRVLFMLLAILLLWKIYNMQNSVKFCTIMSSIYSIFFFEKFLLSDRIKRKSTADKERFTLATTHVKMCLLLHSILQKPSCFITGFLTLIICLLFVEDIHKLLSFISMQNDTLNSVALCI